MVLPSFAIKGYLTQKRYDSKRAKLAKKKKVKRKYNEVELPTTHKAYHHQMVCELIGRARSSFAYFMDMGTGKTKITIDLFLYRRMTGESKRMLVLVPATTNMYEWADQIAEHAPHLTVHIVDQAGRAPRREGVMGDEDVVVATYAGWGWIISASDTKMSLQNRTATKFEKLFQTIVWDEADILAKRSSVYWRAANRLTRYDNFRYLLTGTPTNRDPMAYWSLVSLVDSEMTVGTHAFFREVFFTKEDLPFSKYSCRYNFKTRLTKDLARIIRESSISYLTDESTLPPLVGGILGKRLLLSQCVAPTDTWKRYQAMKDVLDEARGDAKKAERSYDAIRGLTSGWMKYKDAEDREQVVKFQNNPKADLMLQILHEFPKESVIVFHHYTLTNEVICERLEAAGISYGRLYGGNTAKQNNAAYQDFKQGKFRVLVASSAGARGLNPQRMCRRIIMYEPFDSPRVRMQAEKRVYRDQQTKVCFIHDLVMRGTLDQRIIKSTKEGKNLRDLILKTPQS